MRLDDRVTVLKKNVSTDQYGEETTSYTEGETFFAAVRVSTPSEARQGSVPEESASVTVTARSEDVDQLGLGRDSRLKYDGDTLRVHGLQGFERDGFDRLPCTRVR
jgi:head-tail adaptor